MMKYFSKYYKVFMIAGIVFFGSRPAVAAPHFETSSHGATQIAFNDEGKLLDPVFSSPIYIRKYSVCDIGQPYFVASTWRNGIIRIGYDKNSGLSVEPYNGPDSPIRRGRRQIENFKISQTRLYFMTRSRLYEIDASSPSSAYQEVGLKGVRGGSRPCAVEVFDGLLYLATTFNGIYRRTGETFKNISAGLPRIKYSWKEYFYTGISKLFTVKGILFVLLEDHTVYRFEPGAVRWYREEKLPLIKDCFENSSGRVFVAAVGNKMYLSNHIYRFDIGDNQKAFLKPYKEGGHDQGNDSAGVGNAARTIFRIAPKPHDTNVVSTAGEKSFFLTRYTPVKKVYPWKRMFTKDVSGKRCLFINLDFIRYSDMDYVTKLLREKKVNALVINFKDDTGNLIYGSEIPLAKAAGASMVHSKLHRFLDKVRPYNPYIIARLVMFKDFRLHKYQRGKYALWDKVKDKPWRVNDIEYWVDPYSEDVIKYNLDVVKELGRRQEEFMLRELQFDYIRMPSDKALKNAVCKYKKQGWERYDILENFLSRINEVTVLPYSIDIYGYNAIYKMGNIIGQDVEAISKYAPVVCPMFYPSHFGPLYLSGKERIQAYHVFEFGVKMALKHSVSGTIIRPYTQAFSYKARPAYDKNYIAEQLKGAKDGGADGYGYWNAVSRYGTLYRFLSSIDRKTIEF